jgi:RNA polymerase primary sigma factor
LHFRFIVLFLISYLNCAFADKVCGRSLTRRSPRAASQTKVPDLLAPTREAALGRILLEARAELDRIESETGTRPKPTKLNSPLQRLAASAREELILANARLVPHVLKQFPTRIEREDLIGEGNLGLIEAVDRYDFRYQNRFATYAVWWIRAFIRHALLQTYPTIRVSGHMLKLLAKAKQAQRKLSQELGKPLTLDQVLENSEFTRSHKELIREARRLQDVSPLPGQRKDDDHITGDFRDPRHPSSNVDEEVDHDQEIQRLTESIDQTLTPLEKRVVELRYGLNGNQRHTLSSASKQVGVSRNRVSRILARALSTLEIALGEFQGDL